MYSTFAASVNIWLFSSFLLLGINQAAVTSLFSCRNSRDAVTLPDAVRTHSAQRSWLLPLFGAERLEVGFSSFTLSPFYFYYFLSLIGVWLLYSTVLVSVIQQHESAVKFTYIPSHHPPHPILLGCHGSFPQAVYFTHSSVYMSMLLSQLVPPSPSPAVSTSPFSTSVPLFPPYKQVHQHHFSRFHIYALICYICFSPSDLLHSVWETLCPSTSPQMIQCCSFLWLSNIPLYICITRSLSIYLLMDI